MSEDKVIQDSRQSEVLQGPFVKPLTEPGHVGLDANPEYLQRLQATYDAVRRKRPSKPFHPAVRPLPIVADDPVLCTVQEQIEELEVQFQSAEQKLQAAEKHLDYAVEKYAGDPDNIAIDDAEMRVVSARRRLAGLQKQRSAAQTTLAYAHQDAVKRTREAAITQHKEMARQAILATAILIDLQEQDDSLRRMMIRNKLANRNGTVALPELPKIQHAVSPAQYLKTVQAKLEAVYGPLTEDDKSKGKK